MNEIDSNTSYVLTTGDPLISGVIHYSISVTKGSNRTQMDLQLHVLQIVILLHERCFSYESFPFLQNTKASWWENERINEFSKIICYDRNTNKSA